MPDTDEPVTAPPAPESPAEADQPEPTPKESTPEPAAEWSNWLYTGPGVRVYTTVPVTATAGVVITWHSNPGTDGAWQRTDEPANTMPDNYRPEPESADGGAEHTEEG
jgi:hypothetical protein